ncbi:protein-disulfide reductase DsbD [Mucilaginibacter sp. L3T2-6]|uniref:protein-disulfide reductase DsbD family protein n=1 Tax=Mucilaginibacter sp. L3T2-6 TaxID=3062491 RepID=UPI002675C451|nr:cytochrome c biogenesis protein CcdA [Mucilaginibacter sp. L3T2-6]MDO3643769.1 cytochrome c biogenesis protein CcdA [Mucilaginibacter sp. L3T2-6]MDV6216220.1 cytochrome c biogenesis protein CcdA [Mucilaginibacter sp. L3T2-6]
MKLFKGRGAIKTGLFLLVAFVVFFALGVKPVKAFQNKKSDTAVSTSDVQFTDIPTAADSAKEFQKKQAELKKKQATITTAQPAAEKSQTLWEIFIAGFVGGLLAITMPCIYPLLPLTVSFFTKKTGSRARGILHSLLYGLSIIVIYVSLGLIITLIFGPDALNALATNGIFNIFFFLLLIVFGISFLGAFEINLPSSLANKLDQNSEKGGIIGIFFMAATLVVVSFSCTGPLVGSLLAAAATKGDRLAPAMGMFGFSLALALPFTLFALFPSALKSLPKSGGWLNSIKVVLGFLELGFSLKFLSNVDLAYHWNWFDREIFLSLWIALALLMGLYLIGKIKFSHDDDLPHLSVPRTFIAIIVFAFTFYMIPGLWGAPLKALSGFLPPPATQDFDLSRISAGTAAEPVQNVSIKEKKYEKVFERGKHAGLNEWYDYDQALQVSKELKKPILIDFTGWNCANCRKMENDVWPDPRVRKHMQNDFVLLELYVDEKVAQLPPNEVYTSTYSGKKITTVGGKNSDYETVKFNTNSQPYYVITDSEGNVLVPPQGANFNVDNYVKYLESGLAAYKSKQ